MTFTPFASVDDYRTRYPEASSSDAAIEWALLDASTQIADVLDGANIDWSEPSERQSIEYKSVCLAAAHRALGIDENDAIPFGASQFSQSASPYSVSASFTGGAYGDVRLWNSEIRRLLGIRTAAAYSFPGGVSNA